LSATDYSGTGISEWKGAASSCSKGKTSCTVSFNGDGIKPLDFEVCDNTGVCTKGSTTIYIDTTPPVITCNASAARLTQSYTTLIGDSLSVNLYYSSGGSSCEAYMSSLKTCPGSISPGSNYYSVLTATDSLSGVNLNSKKLIATSFVNENGGNSFSQRSCYCDDSWCEMNYTVQYTDYAGNSSSETFTYYVSYHSIVTMNDGKPTGCTNSGGFGNLGSLDSECIK
jgi:hypothetical protein